MIGPYSRKHIYATFEQWRVPTEYAVSLYNYLTMGLMPGGFFTSVLANDWNGAIVRSHPSNTIEALKAATGWICDHVPSQARGSYEAVEAWSQLSNEARSQALREQGLLLNDKDETLMALKGISTEAPILY